MTLMLQPKTLLDFCMSKVIGESPAYALDVLPFVRKKEMIYHVETYAHLAQAPGTTIGDYMRSLHAPKKAYALTIKRALAEPLLALRRGDCDRFWECLCPENMHSFVIPVVQTNDAELILKFVLHLHSAFGWTRARDSFFGQGLAVWTRDTMEQISNVLQVVTHSSRFASNPNNDLFACALHEVCGNLIQLDDSHFCVHLLQEVICTLGTSGRTDRLAHIISEGYASTWTVLGCLIDCSRPTEALYLVVSDLIEKGEGVASSKAVPLEKAGVMKCILKTRDPVRIERAVNRGWDASLEGEELKITLDAARDCGNIEYLKTKFMQAVFRPLPNFDTLFRADDCTWHKQCANICMPRVPLSAEATDLQTFVCTEWNLADLRCALQVFRGSPDLKSSVQSALECRPMLEGHIKLITDWKAWPPRSFKTICDGFNAALFTGGLPLATAVLEADMIDPLKLSVPETGALEDVRLAEYLLVKGCSMDFNTPLGHCKSPTGLKMLLPHMSDSAVCKAVKSSLVACLELQAPNAEHWLEHCCVVAEYLRADADSQHARRFTSMVRHALKCMS